MGVYIQGMDVSRLEKGRKYVAEFSVLFDGRMDFGLVTSAFLEKPKTIEHFPCVSVPPSGRLIDADAFIKAECNRCDGWCDVVECSCLSCRSDHRCEFIIDLADQPTIIEGEEAKR